VLSARAVPRSYKKDNWGNQVSSERESVKKRGSWKGTAFQRGLEPESKELAIIISRYQEAISEETAGWERLRVIL
jgi:hypothetical protein